MSNRWEALERALNLVVDLIPTEASNRPMIPIRPGFLTVHETANRSAGADALVHSRYLKSEAARRRKVSWHFTVDGRRAVKHLPVQEMGWHCGDRTGNLQSLGLEICVNADGDFEQACDRAARLAALLRFRVGLPLDAIVPHRYWTGKDCPQRLLAQNGVLWRRFLQKVDAYRNGV